MPCSPEQVGDRRCHRGIPPTFVEAFVACKERRRHNQCRLHSGRRFSPGKSRWYSLRPRDTSRRTLRGALETRAKCAPLARIIHESLPLVLGIGIVLMAHDWCKLRFNDCCWVTLRATGPARNNWLDVITALANRELYPG